uniref:Uncharacterized protein n=1 Tax=Panagrolaimus davidi TaxID=227884 RepID=A0A914QUK2_9BILA
MFLQKNDQKTTASLPAPETTNQPSIYIIVILAITVINFFILISIGAYFYFQRPVSLKQQVRAMADIVMNQYTV